MRRILFSLLVIFTTTSMAGSFADSANGDQSPQNNKASNQHFYVDVGGNAYYFDQPGVRLPVSTGYSYPMHGTPRGTDHNQANSDSGFVPMPTLTFGYDFLSPDQKLAKIFGEQNALEVKAAYFKSSGVFTNTYPAGYYVNPWYITGASETFNLDGESYTLDRTDWNFDNTMASVGVYYTGQKVLQHNLINSPYVGLSLTYLEQDADYTAVLVDNVSVNHTMIGSDDLDSYYTGVELGDKLALPFQRHFSVYGKAGLGLYFLHTSLTATQLPQQESAVDQDLNTTYTVNEDSNTLAYKAVLETGISYYFGNNQDPIAPRVTLLSGIEYWSDMAYADNPSAANTKVAIAYADSIDPYAGVRVHIPIV